MNFVSFKVGLNGVPMLRLLIIRQNLDSTNCSTPTGENQKFRSYNTDLNSTNNRKMRFLRDPSVTPDFCFENDFKKGVDRDYALVEPAISFFDKELCAPKGQSYKPSCDRCGLNDPYDKVQLYETYCLTVC